mgnify:CR=1 FL=1
MYIKHAFRLNKHHIFCKRIRCQASEYACAKRLCNTCRYDFFAESVHQSTAQCTYHASRECHEASKSCQVSDDTRTKCHTDTPYWS